MTRKRYIHLLDTLTIAVYRSEHNFLPEGSKLGDAFKHHRDYAKKVPKNAGSYEAAWNSKAMKSVRDMVGM